MQKLRTYIIIFFIILGSFSRAATPNQLSMENAAFLSGIYNNSWALVIGINDYTTMPPLQYAVNDAMSVKQMLHETYGFQEDQILMVLNEEATRQNILDQFNELLNKAKEDDRVIIFYAGHGETQPLPSGGDRGYLIPVDGDPNNLWRTCIAMDDIYDIASLSYAKHILYLVDACYGGLAIRGTRGLTKSIPNYIQRIAKERGRQIITAGGKDEQVLEKSEWGHSAFTRNLIKGLGEGFADADGDGVITTDELGDFMTQRVADDTEGAHTPQRGQIGDDLGELLFINQNADAGALAEYQAQLQQKRNQYSSAKNLGLFLPGSGHFMLGQKIKGSVFAIGSMGSLSASIATLQSFLSTRSQYKNSQLNYNNYGTDNYTGPIGTDVLDGLRQQTTKDYRKYFYSQIKLGSALTSTLLFWGYSIYDLRKQKYYYTDINQHQWNVGITPLGQVEIRFRF